MQINFIKKLLLCFCIVVPIIVNGQPNRYSAKITTSYNIDLQGMDYKSVELEVANYKQCESLCLQDPNCMAYTYVKPGYQGTKARCYLKSNVPDEIENEYCISGVKLNIQPSNYSNLDNKVQQPMQKVEFISGLPIPLPDPNDKKIDNYKPYQLIEAVPINLPIPRPDLATNRSELLKSAQEIPNINKQLLGMANSKGMNLNSLNSITFEGKTARTSVTTGQTFNDIKNIAPTGSVFNVSQVDWSGGVRLTPMNPISKLGYWQNGKFFPVASMRIYGVVVSEQLPIDFMVKNNIAMIDAGYLQLYLDLPNKSREPYLITLNNFINKNYATWKLDVLNFKSSNETIGTLKLNPEGDKYIGIVNLGQEDMVTRIEIYKLIFSGVTLTKL